MSDLPHESLKPKSSTLVNGNGWDGKLRVEKRAVLSEPEGLSDPEDPEEEIVSSEQIVIDEGKVLPYLDKLARS